MSKIGILHVSDMHIDGETHFITSKAKHIASATKNEWLGCEKMAIIASGDFILKGNPTLFAIAERFLVSLRKEIEEVSNLSCLIFCVPGNHDCNFASDNMLRKKAIAGIDYNEIGNDASIVSCATSIQDEYWDFHERLTGSKPENRLYWTAEMELKEHSISFLGMNTSWMSKQVEDNKLFFPVRNINSKLINKKSLCIAVFHHPTAWLSPNTEKNNRNEFEEFIEDNASLALYGHEHETSVKLIERLTDRSGVVSISGSALYSTWQEHSSAFQTLQIDVSSNEFLFRSYRWNGDVFAQEENLTGSLSRAQVYKSGFAPAPDFIDSISSINIPLIDINSKQAKLSDVFVFPDLEPKKSTDERLINHDSSNRLLKMSKSLIFIEGESQCGKTSLSHMLFKQSITAGWIPLLVANGKFTRKGEFEITIKEEYERQYDCKVQDYEHFRQAPNANKILIVDGISPHQCTSSELIALITHANSYFGKIVFLTSDTISWAIRIESKFPDVAFYKILPFGYQKRAELIEKYHIFYNEYRYDQNDQEIIEATRHSIATVKTVFGNRLIPAYPVYIATILQALTASSDAQKDFTSYGYCYHTLIHFALSKKSGITQKKIDSYYNLLTELAFWLFKQNLKRLSAHQFDEFYSWYITQFIGVDSPLARITASYLIKREDEYYSFTYPYIYLFLVAKKIAEIIGTEEGRGLIRGFCTDLNCADSAHILVFIAHHTKDDFLLDETILSAMIPFSDYKPVTLEKQSEYYALLQDAVKVIASDVLEIDRDPRQERQKQLERSDDIKDRVEKVEEATVDANHVLAPILVTMRAMDIIGQILKNRHGSLKIPKMQVMVEEMYTSAFRMITYFGSEIIRAKSDFIEATKSDADLRKSLTVRGISDIEGEVAKLMHQLSFLVCASMISRLTTSLSQRDLKQIYDHVSVKINSPIAKLVTFSIISSFSQISLVDLKDLAEDFKGNPVAIQMLNNIVRRHVYNNVVDHNTKAKIASITGLRLETKAGIKTPTKRHGSN